MSEEEEGKEKGMETFWLQTSKVSTSRKIDSQWAFAVWLRELKLGLGNNLEAWGGDGGGRDIQVGGDTYIPMADSCWCLVETNKYCKAIILQLNINKNLKSTNNKC